jgi:hypothetical protein
LKTNVTPSKREITSTTIARSLRLERLNVIGTINGVDANSIGGVVRTSEVTVGVLCRNGFTCLKVEKKKIWKPQQLDAVPRAWGNAKKSALVDSIRHTNLDFSLQANRGITGISHSEDASKPIPAEVTDFQDF